METSYNYMTFPIILLAIVSFKSKNISNQIHKISLDDQS